MLKHGHRKESYRWTGLTLESVRKCLTTAQTKIHWIYSTPLKVPKSFNQKLETESDYTTAIHFCDIEIKIHSDFLKHFYVPEYNFPLTRNTKVWLNENFCFYQWPTAIDRYLQAFACRQNSLCLFCHPANMILLKLHQTVTSRFFVPNTLYCT
jgi:hypothetical protein